MNMSLKITNRDKILLVLLAVILFAGMMYVYGIMPTNSEIETLEKQITEKQQELRDLQLQVASINISALEKEYDKLLDYYYAADKGELADKVGEIGINRLIVEELLIPHNINAYSTIGWKINEESYTASFGDYKANYFVATATCPTPFKAEAGDLYAFIETVRTNPFFRMSSLSVSYTQDETTGKTVAEGNFVLMYYMRANTGVAEVPALMADVQNVSSEGATVSFDAVEGAVKYEFYIVTDGVDGKNYTLIDKASLNASGDGRQTYTFRTSALELGTYTIAVRAVGDKMQGLFKSPLGDTMQTVEIILA